MSERQDEKRLGYAAPGRRWQLDCQVGRAAIVLVEPWIAGRRELPAVVKLRIGAPPPAAWAATSIGRTDIASITAGQRGENERLDRDDQPGFTDHERPGRLDFACQCKIIDREVHDASCARVPCRKVDQVKAVVSVKTDTCDQDVRRVGDEPATRIFKRRAAVHRHPRPQDVLNGALQLNRGVYEQHVFDQAARQSWLNNHVRIRNRARRLGNELEYTRRSTQNRGWRINPIVALHSNLQRPHPGAPTYRE